jgi:DNA-binding CsgD family transcriptional regulator
LAESVYAFPHSAHRDEGNLLRLRAWLATALLLRGDTGSALRSLQGIPAHRCDAQCGDPCLEVLWLNALSHTDEIAAATVADRVLAAKEAHNNQVRAAALAIRAKAQWREGRLDEAFGWLDQAVALRGPLTSIWQHDPLWTRAWMLTKVRRLDEAMSTVDSMRRAIDLERIGVLAAVPLALRAWVHLAQGELAKAEADAAAGITASVDAQMPLCQPQLRAVRVVIALRRGDLATAAERLVLLEDVIPGQATHPWWAMRCLVTAQVTAARRGPRAALEVLREIYRDPGKRRQLVLEDPSATAWCVRTALAAGNREIAELIAATTEEISTTSLSQPAVTAAATHGRALLTRHTKALADRAEDYGDPWATISANEDLGVLLYETDRERAIAVLNTAMAAYDQLGAVWDSARVRKRLRQLGVRRRHWDHVARPQTGWGSLTKAEDKVARLVARGLTNQQVANELFLSPHTVDFHLRQIYRKLAIQSRVDLARIAP